MKRVFVFMLVVLLSASFVMANGDHVHEAEEGSEHGHGIYNAFAEDAPILNIEVLEDPKSGWNVHLITENFEFAPKDASLEHELGKGHAHIYVNGEKINRVYGEWYHIAELSEGQHRISARLSTNDHNEYAVDSQVIEDSVLVNVLEEKASQSHGEHSHNSDIKSAYGEIDESGIFIIAIVVGFVLGFLVSEGWGKKYPIQKK